MKNRKCHTATVFPLAILNTKGKKNKICSFIVFPRNKSKKIIGLPKFTEMRKYCSLSQTTHVYSLRLQNSPVFAYSSTSKQSNKMSGARLETEIDTGERR